MLIHYISQVGSRLKTPSLPVWVVCAEDNWGVLFSPNVDLMKANNMENRWTLNTRTIHAIYSIILFRITLHYYSGSRHFNHLKRDTLIQITSDVEDPDPEKDRSDISGGFCLKKAIQSKYTTAINMF